MKAKVKLALPGFAGNMNDLVIYYNRQLDKLIARRKVIPAHIPDGSVMKQGFALARRIALSPAYKADCRRYILAYNTHNRQNGRKLSAWSNLWLQIMRSLKANHPELDLSTLTRAGLISLGCGSIASAVEAKLIDKVPGWDQLTEEV